MSDFEIDWGTEDGLHVDHGGGVDHVFTDNQFDDRHDFSDGTDSAPDITDLYSIGDAAGDAAGDADGGDIGDEPLQLDDPAMPDWQLDPAFTDGHYDLVGADPHEDDMWSQFMTDMHEEINPYAAN